MEPFTGRRRDSSRFPQYLIKAILEQATAVAVDGVIGPHMEHVSYGISVPCEWGYEEPSMGKAGRVERER